MVPAVTTSRSSSRGRPTSRSTPPARINANAASERGTVGNPVRARLPAEKVAGVSVPLTEGGPPGAEGPLGVVVPGAPGAGLTSLPLTTAGDATEEVAVAVFESAFESAVAPCLRTLTSAVFTSVVPAGGA